MEVPHVKTLTLIGAAALALCGAPLAADSAGAVEVELLGLERKALDGWQTGDAGPAVANSGAGITYFHAMTDGRLDGLPGLKDLYGRYRGTPLFDSYEIVQPKLQLAGEAAVLTYILVSHNGATATRWNATQVYQKLPEGWRVIHSHWSMTRPR